MSHQAVTWAYEQESERPLAKFVLVTLANYASTEGYCFPSQQKIADETGISVRAVRGYLADLEAAGIILRQPRYDRRGKRSSDGFWLIGFKPLPANLAASPPAPRAASSRSLPANDVVTTGTTCRDYRHVVPHLNRTEPSDEPSVNRQSYAAAPARERDEVWDALTELCGAPGTKSERSDFGRTVKELTAIEATPDEIAAFGPWWFQRHGDAELTHRCLRNHFGRFRTQPARPAQLSDIRNPMVRSALTVDLSDITAELEAKHGPRRGLPREAHDAGALPAVARRVGAGERPADQDVLPATRRAGTG